MLITKEVDVVLNSQNIKYYEDLGYKISREKDINYRLVVKRGTIIKVNISDLPLGSDCLIEFSCDYCGCQSSRTYYLYNKLKNSLIKKDCCDNYNCRKTKAEEINFIKYGNSKFLSLTKTREKIAKKRRINFNSIIEEYNKVGFTLLAKPEDYINGQTKLKCVCRKHANIIQYKARMQTAKGFGCKLCDNENRTGSSSSTWKGGITPLHNYLREKIYSWKFDSMKKDNFKCAVTGLKFDTVHHLYGFSDILIETLSELNFPLFDKINEYTDIELKQIEDKCLELHYKHGLGVCLTEYIHKLFHSLYGYGNNIPEQFEEFKQRYNNGEFINIIQSA